jgi:hypothetical protein
VRPENFFALVAKATRFGTLFAAFLHRLGPYYGLPRFIITPVSVMYRLRRLLFARRHPFALFGDGYGDAP